MKLPIQVQAQSIKKMYDSLYEDLKVKYGLTMNEIMFLLYLDKHQMKNTAREIVEDLMVTKSHISKSVDSLARDNIIIRVRDEFDKKIIRLYISESADSLLNELKEREKWIMKNITAGISKEELETFNKVLEMMQKNMMKFSEKRKN
ncbi:MAG: MarR family transcriptional regulator [Erysipelotrichaceae bacterium]|nr:MarR family transcriptional regulator [Erysipelotrichaceae bacterium]